MFVLIHDSISSMALKRFFQVYKYMFLKKIIYRPYLDQFLSDIKKIGTIMIGEASSLS